MPVSPKDLAAFLESMLAELKSPKSAGVRIVRITALLEKTERTFDQRAFFGTKASPNTGPRQEVSPDSDGLFWRCGSELRRILKANLSDEGKCLTIETLVSEAREELRSGMTDEPLGSSEG